MEYALYQEQWQGKGKEPHSDDSAEPSDVDDGAHAHPTPLQEDTEEHSDLDSDSMREDQST